MRYCQQWAELRLVRGTQGSHQMSRRDRTHSFRVPTLWTIARVQTSQVEWRERRSGIALIDSEWRRKQNQLETAGV